MKYLIKRGAFLIKGRVCLDNGKRQRKIRNLKILKILPTEIKGRDLPELANGFFSSNIQRCLLAIAVRYSSEVLFLIALKIRNIHYFIHNLAGCYFV